MIGTQARRQEPSPLPSIPFTCLEGTFGSCCTYQDFGQSEGEASGCTAAYYNKGAFGWCVDTAVENQLTTHSAVAIRTRRFAARQFWGTERTTAADSPLMLAKGLFESKYTQSVVAFRGARPDHEQQDPMSFSTCKSIPSTIPTLVGFDAETCTGCLLFAIV